MVLKKEKKYNIFMKKMSFILILMVLCILPSVHAQKSASLKVVIDSITFNKGQLFVALYDSKSGFKHDSIFKKNITTVTDTQESLLFQLPVGRSYAVAVFQDLNNDSILNRRGTMKIPDEPIGFSNNILGKFGPPGFDNISFILSDDTTIQISIVSSRREYFRNLH